jgi:hypothetical protein
MKFSVDDVLDKLKVIESQIRAKVGSDSVCEFDAERVMIGLELALRIIKKEA